MSVHFVAPGARIGVVHFVAPVEPSVPLAGGENRCQFILLPQRTQRAAGWEIKMN